MKKICSLFAMAFVFASCSTPSYVQQDDSIRLTDYKTYMWIDTRANENDQSARATAYADIPVRNEVNKRLKDWGWQEVNDNPDVLASYEVLVERSRETRRDPIYSGSFTRSYFNPYTRRWSTMYYPSQFQGYQVYDTPVRDGTVTITLVDSKTDKNIWQGWTTERLSGSRLSDDQVRGTIQRIFDKNR